MTSAVAAALRPIRFPSSSALRGDPVAQAFLLLRIGFTVAPRFGGLLVAGWLGGIIVNLVVVGGYDDVALRDFGLLPGALTLARRAVPPGGSVAR